MDNNNIGQPLRTVDEQITYDPDGQKVTTITTKTVTQKEDGSTRISERIVTKKKGNEINVADSTIVGEKEVVAGNNETQYIDAIKTKGELAILKGENQLMNIVNLESFEVILRLMGINLNEFYYYVSFGIYSSEEIYEFRKSISTKIENKDKVDEYYKDYDYMTESDDKLILPTLFGDEIFERVQKRIDIIMAEQKRKKIEEELRLKQELEEKERKGEEELRIKKQEEGRLQREKEEEDRKKREKEEMEKLEEEERKRKEEEMRLEKEEKEKLKKEEEEKRKKEFEEKRQKENEEKKMREKEIQKKKEMEIKKKKEEEENKKKEMEEKKKKVLEETIKKKKEEEEKIKKGFEEQKKEEDFKKKTLLENKKKKEEETKKLKEKELQKKKEFEAKMKEEASKLKGKELQKKKEEEEKKKEEIRKKKEEEAKKKKELENNKKKEEELKKRKILEEKKKKEEDKKKKEEDIKKKKELEEKKKMKEEEKEKKKLELQRKKEEEEKKRKEEETIKKEKKKKEEEEKRKEEEELRKKIEAKKNQQKSPDKKILKQAKPTKQLKKNIERSQTDYPLKSKASLEKEKEKESENPEGEKLEEENGEKPKKKKKIIKKTITKMVKKKVHKDSLEYLNYLKEKERGFKAGGVSSSGVGGIGISYTTNISKPVNCECINCHTNISKNTGKNLCDNCINNLRGPKNNIDLKSLKYYQDDNNDKFETIGTKEFYQLNKDRYLNDLWKEGNDKLTKIDGDFNKNKNEKNEDENDDLDKKQFIFDKPICSKCGKIQNKNLNKGIYFCKNCEGLICGNCSKAHYKENPDHSCNHVNVEERKYWKAPQNLKCSNCNQFHPINTIYNCNICEGKPICKNCTQEHNLINPNHIVKLFGKAEEDILEKTLTKKNKAEKKTDLSKCPNCGTKVIISYNSMTPCPTCKTILCDKCQNEHFIKNPSHSKPTDNIFKSDKKKYKHKLSEDKIYRKKSADIPKCSECGKINSKDNDYMNKCNNCQIFLCDNCGDKHKLKNKNHNIVKTPNQTSEKNIPSKKAKINIGTKCKDCNESLPLRDEECIIVNCIDCEGNLCDDCCENHEKNNPQHDLNPIRILFIENTTYINDSIQKLKCNNCRKYINDFDKIYYCDECQIDLCNICGNSHNSDNSGHDLILTKRILIDDNSKGSIKCRQCGKDLGNDDNTYKKCDKCKIDLCEACGENHIEKFSNHNILYTLCKNNYDKNISDCNYKDFENKLKTPNDKCNNCNKKINAKNNDIINFCNNCNGNLCDNCNNIHSKNYPDHIKTTPRVILLDKYMDLKDYSKWPIYKCIACDKNLKVNLNNPYIKCDKCNGNICDDCNTNHLQEFPTHKLELNKYIIPDENEDIKYLYDNIPINLECISCYDQIPLKQETDYCLECQGSLCKNCLKLHSKNKKNHNPRILNSILIEKTKDNIFNPPNIICNSCNKNLDKKINEYIHNCPKCKQNLCDDCFSNHSIEYPNHNTNLNKYIFYDIKEEDENNIIKNKLNILKLIPYDKCSICDKNARPGNNNLITHCNKCKGSLCNSCEINHSSLFPGHDNIIKKYTINKNKIIDNENLIQNDKCFKCQRNIPIINDGFIIYCLNCPGNMCNSCGSNHTTKNPEHKICNFNTKKLEKTKEELFKCGDCGNEINTNTIYNCNKCDKNLCDKCTNSHLKKNDKNYHNLVFIKYIEESDYPIVECDVCGRIIKNKNGVYGNYKCDKCLANLCEPCCKTHIKKYPNHKIKQLFSSLERDKIEENKSVHDNENDKCLNCKQIINLKNNDIINYCKNCKGNLCNNCSKRHIKENPSHFIVRPIIILKLKKDLIKLPIYKCIACDKKLSADLNIPYNNCDKCHGNLCDDCNNTHSKDFPGHSSLLIKYLTIIDDDKYKTNLLENFPIHLNCYFCGAKLPINKEIYHCINCKGNLCNNCTQLHEKNNLNHKPRKLNINLLNNEINKISNIKCNCCGNNLNKNINDYIRNCLECQNILCDNCYLKHNKEYPEHNLYLDKYIFYEILDDSDLFNQIPLEKCFICNNNIKIRNGQNVSYCNKCKGNLCDDCEENHNSLFPGHEFIIQKYIFNLNPNNNNEKEDKNIINLNNINLNKNDKCLICYKDIPINNNDIIIYCHICQGSLCNTCNEEHLKSYPDHKTLELKSLLIDDFDKENKYNNKCGKCGNKITNTTFFNCIKCNNNLCNKCTHSHIKISPEHELLIVKNKLKDNLYDDLDNKCLICNKELYYKNNDIINYCLNCKGILCDNCDQSHKEEYSEHLKSTPTVLLLNKNIENYNKLPIYNCIVCGKSLKGDLKEIYINCDKCHGNICNECNDTHIKEFQIHKLKLIKYLFDLNNSQEKYNNNIKYNINNDLEEKNIEKPRIKVRSTKINIKDDVDLNNLNNKDIISKDNLKRDSLSPQKRMNEPHQMNCISCNKKINNFKECRPCYGYLCNSCNKSNENNFKIINQEKSSLFCSAIVNCKICNEFLLKNINDPINYCSVCNGNICSNCSINHLSQYSNHNLLLTKFILTQYISNEDKFLSNKNICLDCNKNLDHNKLIHLCNQCKGKICSECVENHNNENPEHILILSKNFGNNGIFPGIREKGCFCYICKLNHYEAQTKKYYYCKECNAYICESCKNRHDEKYYSHIILNPHNYEDYKRKNNNK